MGKDLDREARGRRLATLLDHPGWGEVEKYIDMEINDAMEALTSLMMSQPEKVTGRVAFKHGFTIKTLKNLKEFVHDEINNLKD